MERKIPFKGLRVSLLKEAGYTAKDRVYCRNCKYYTIEYDAPTSEDVETYQSYCVLHDKYKLPVVSYGRCNYHESKR